MSIRQPYAEQILRGDKRIEYRSTATHRRGRIYIYASRTPGRREAWAECGAVPGGLPTGVVVGTVRIGGCSKANGQWHWHLTDARRIKPRKPRRPPNVTWFYPF